jgi:hypothetical protein
LGSFFLKSLMQLNEMMLNNGVIRTPLKGIPKGKRGLP